MPIDVVIAGAGPNGLMLACELALAGVRPLVLERLSGPSGEQRANGLVGQVVRMLDRRGLHERLSGTTAPPSPAPAFMFGAFPLDLAALSDNPVYLLMVPQRRIEEMLAERAAELGVEIRRGHELTGLTQDSGAVTVEVAGPAGPYRIEARFLVGADGGHSVVRKLAGIGFPGVTTDRRISRSGHVSMPAELIDPVSGGLLIPGYGAVPPFLHHRTERGLITFAPFPSGPPLVSTTEMLPPGHDARFDEPLTISELRDSIQRVLGVDVPISPPEGAGPHMLRRLTGGNTRLADRFRADRILLVGDAAHVHSAMGGPGLNLGLQDAINLGWKLAAELRGWAPEGLLDSYEAERRPAGQRVTMHTQAQGVLVGPGSEITALRELFGELLADQNTLQRLADLIAGADIRYDMGAGLGDAGAARGGAGATASLDDAAAAALTGRWAPDLLLHTETGTVRLAELTRDARPLLLDLTDGGKLADVAAPWRDRVEVVTARCDDPGVTGLLLRPDCYVAWASASPSPDDRRRAELRSALSRWFGHPGDTGAEGADQSSVGARV
ncbi:FAD-dependent monooxygenase [Planotetraspora phitsanulokensis]|uniref:FAD-dependent oxidoreductase n=1 Tax=Planotetraspora phitsanulokensis TaxID=575192 RepID=A0A8J3U597_9ACTN|nr:FAD-dependent monooxygenase [Planotetraspora phitsanulokensis]GII37411.1 FAD-dependent oxidoreductase [Planotetraspora phitsanulokensis]